jgi:hypothetical protein
VLFPFSWLLITGAASIIRHVGSSCSILKQLKESSAAASSSNGAMSPQHQRQQVQLLTAMGQLQGLLSDVWAAMKLLGTGCLQGEPAVAAAATAAAAAGHNLLLGLAAVSDGVAQQQQQGEEEGVDADGLTQELQQQLESRCLARQADD